MKRKIKHEIFSTLSVVFLLFLNAFLYAQPCPPIIPTIYDTAAASGYYFFTPKYTNTTWNTPGGVQETQMILDGYGDIIYFRTQTVERGQDFKIQPNGVMTYSDKGRFILMDSAFNVIDTVKPKLGINFDGHDFQILPNGHFLFLGAEKIQMDLSSYHMFNNTNDPGGSAAIVRSAVIQEQDANKNVVFNWRSKDYFPFEDTDPAYLLDTGEVDWTHANAIEPDQDGNLLLSIRRFNEIAKINRTDSTVMWRFGGKKNQFTFIGDTTQFKTQHDIRKISNGNITMFDNGYANPFQHAVAREYTINETLKTASLVWSYTNDSNKYSSYLGNVQRLSNGNSIVDYGHLLGSNIIFNCVDSIGNQIMEVRSVDSLNSYRTYFYPTLPWSLNRPKIYCDQNGGQVTLSVDSGLNKYIWSTGDTTFKITITSPGTYHVYVSRGKGGYLKSEKLVVADMLNPCPCPALSIPSPINGPATTCEGTTITYSVNAVPGAISYAWTLPSGWSGSSSTDSINVTVGGTGGIVSVTASEGCSNSPVRNITVNVPPKPAIPGSINTSGGNNKACPGDVKNYSINPVNNAISYTWFPPAGSSITGGQGTTNASISFGSGFTLSDSLRVTADNVCGISEPKSVFIKYNLPSKPGIITGPITVCQNQQNVPYSIAAVNGADTYTWAGPSGCRFSDGTTSSLSATFITPSNAVTVNFKTTAGYIKVNANNECGSGSKKSLAVAINCRSILSETELQSLMISPNPVHDKINISFSLSKEETFEIQLTDVFGRMVKSLNGTGKSGKNEIQMEMKNVNRGFYILTLYSHYGNQVLRVMVD